MLFVSCKYALEKYLKQYAERKFLFKNLSSHSSIFVDVYAKYFEYLQERKKLEFKKNEIHFFQL